MRLFITGLMLCAAVFAASLRADTLILNDGPIGGYSLNGKSFPATQPLKAK